MRDLRTLDSIGLSEVYNNSFYTISGAGGNLDEWMDSYERLFAEQEIGRPEFWITFTGQDVNDEYSLEGNNRFQDDLVFLAFPLDGLDMAKLAIFKMNHHDRWFDDIIDNSRSRPSYSESMSF